MATAVAKINIADFERMVAQLPEEETGRWELVDGEIRRKPEASMKHTFLRDRLGRKLADAVDRLGIGIVAWEHEYEFDEDVRKPDLSYFSNAKKPLINWERRIQAFVPDLAIEVVSPSNTLAELHAKVDLYLRCGVKEAWWIDPESRRAYVFSASREQLLNDAGVFSTELIPGLSIPLRDLFDR